LNAIRPLTLTTEDGFVKETMTFIISDDLFVMPNLLGTSINLLNKLGVNDINTFEKQTVIIGKKEACFLTFFVIYSVLLLLLLLLLNLWFEIE
jgi:hypothetical protein